MTAWDKRVISRVRVLSICVVCTIYNMDTFTSASLFGILGATWTSIRFNDEYRIYFGEDKINLPTTIIGV